MTVPAGTRSTSYLEKRERRKERRKEKGDFWMWEDLPKILFSDSSCCHDGCYNAWPLVRRYYTIQLVGKGGREDYFVEEVIFPSDG